MYRLIIICVVAMPLLACSPKPPNDALAADLRAAAESVALPDGAVVEPVEEAVLVSAPPPSETARTPAALDTTTIEQRVQAAAEPAQASRVLGRTIVSLGSPTEPGFWLKTPLVKVQSQGRVTNVANGMSAAVVLIPIEGPATAGSRMSLATMRLIEASLTDLTEVEVSLDG